MEQRDLLLVRYPFSDPKDYKIRPALLVSNNLFNKKFHPLVCPITTKQFQGNIQINNFLEKGFLERQSFVKTSVVTTIHSELILKTIGKVNKKVFEKIKKEIIDNF
jgi:mRNA interferase MazF